MRIAEPPAHRLFDSRDAFGDALLEPGRIFAAVGIEVSAHARADGEAGRHRQFERGHLMQARALAAQKLTHRAAALGHVRAEKIDFRMNTRHCRK